MLPTTLNTNEVKNSGGTEIEFVRRSPSNGALLEFQSSAEGYRTPHRLIINHSESGSGLVRRRRSVVRFDKTVAGASGEYRKISFYQVSDIPVGDLADSTEPAIVNANLLSFCASLGASTTILYDGTGNGAVCLLQGTL
jgi:hypothetical protein